VGVVSIVVGLGVIAFVLSHESHPAFQPQYGYKGIKNIAALVRQALENKDLPRSKLFRGMLYGTRTK
jgi:nitrogenase molybdenum-iron protein alpha/beta subunit